MEILEYTSDMQADVTTCYNALTAKVPHCYPIHADELDSVLRSEVYENAYKGQLHSQKTFVAGDRGKVVGFVQVGVGSIGEQDTDRTGVIRFFGYAPGERPTGQALLEKAEAYLNSQTAESILAFPQDYRYRFYHFDHAYLSDALGQVHALLGYNGYERQVGEVFLTWRDYARNPVALALAVDVSVEWEPGRGEYPNVSIRAVREGVEIGICQSVSGGEFSNHPDAQPWFHTTWLGIHDEFQGQGLGRYLLQRTLQEMRDVGYRHAAISTSWKNYRAFLFYSNLGYRVSDWTYALAKNVP